MHPPKTVLAAAVRWLTLLRSSSRETAAAVLANDPRFSDLSALNYHEALVWIDANGLVESADTMGDPAAAVMGALVEAGVGALESVSVDDFPDADFLPEDLLEAAQVLGVAPVVAWEQVRSRLGKVDYERRKLIGSLGEKVLTEHLRQRGLDVYHASIDFDGLGWDLEVRMGNKVAHLEVKTTLSSARARVFLSRNEFEVSQQDPDWLMVVVHIREVGELLRFATADPRAIGGRMPSDSADVARWEVCSLILSAHDLRAGIPGILDCPDAVDQNGTVPLWWPN